MVTTWRPKGSQRFPKSSESAQQGSKQRPKLPKCGAKSEGYALGFTRMLEHEAGSRMVQVSQVLNVEI